MEILVYKQTSKFQTNKWLNEICKRWLTALKHVLLLSKPSLQKTLNVLVEILPYSFLVHLSSTLPYLRQLRK